jgi:sensor histidine kinase YesM
MIDWKELIQRPWLQHGGFWILSTYVLFRVFNQDPENITTDLIYTVLFQISLWFVVYFQLWLLIPRLLKPGRYVVYVLGFVFSLRAGVAINHLTFDYLADWLFPNYYFISFYENGELMQFMLIYGVASTLFKLSKSWFDLNNKEKQINRLEREKLDAELQALRAQLDPHFLFNSLNNVYSLALDADQKVPAYILQLSDNLRYMLYECQAAEVPLSKELEYIRNYLELQRLKTGPEVRIELEVSGKVEACKVAPLLFIPFIENSFKHGLKGKTPNAKILISFVCQEAGLQFRIFNTIAQAPEDSVLPVVGGIGLENVQKRLELLYPNQHHLSIEQDNEQFLVELKLDMAPQVEAVA